MARSAAHSSILRGLTGWVFTHMSFVLPVKRLYETERLVAFEHPSPSYPVHILLVPKAALPGLEALDASDAALLAEVFGAVQVLVRQLGLEPTGYRLIANGGAYQDIPQLHFHLVSGSPAAKPPSP